MTLLDAAESHVRDCVLLETEYEGTKQGSSWPGTGPSLMQRQARETAIQQRRAARLGEELLREDTTFAEPEPQRLGRKVDPACSHRADKPRKRNPSGTSRFHSARSAHFLSQLQKAKQDKGSIKVRKVLSQSDVSSCFEVQGSDSQRRYEVEVFKAPSCTCEDYKKFNEKELCKHVIWVYLYILKVDEESSLINQITLSEDSVRQLLTESLPIASSSVDNISPSNDFRSRMERVKSIPSKDKRKEQQLMWYLLHKERKPGKNPHCKALGCKKEVLPGNLCVFVKGLEVPYQQAFAVQSNFYFCPQLECVQQIPPWSNLAIPDKVSIKGDVSDAEIASALRDGLPLSFDD